MGQQSRRRKYTRCRLISGYFRPLEHLDANLEIACPELEEEKINRAIVLLFGERPSITDFSEPPPDMAGSPT